MPKAGNKAHWRAKKQAIALRNDAIPRAKLGKEVQGRLKKFQITQTTAAKIVDDAATQMSRLANGHFAEFSADRMVKMLNRFGSDVTVTIKHARRLGRRGKCKVVVT